MLEYDGSCFGGWQRQVGVTGTVQQQFEEALKAVTQEDITSFAAGRTDKGVHASGQVAHVDFCRPYDLDRLRRGTNFYLRESGLVVCGVYAVQPDLHARFSARQRRYCYRLLSRPSMSPLREKYVWWIAQALDIAKMKRAAQFFLGTHYFSAFRGKDCQSKRVSKTMDAVTLEQKEDEIHIIFASRSFLHHQVRIMVGTLVEVGLGKRAPEEVRFLLESSPEFPKPRMMAGPTAPASGLCFVGVSYGCEGIMSMV